MISIKRFLTGICVVGLVLGFGIRAQANPFLHSVREQLQLAARTLGWDGYRLSHEPFTGVLRQGETDWIAIRLRSGIEYVIIAVCDQDCRDIDLRLYDENGYLIDDDLALDDVPVVTAIPRRTATFQIEVIMSRCRTRDCVYGVGAFAR